MKSPVSHEALCTFIIATKIGIVTYTKTISQ
jgi:hypothetical protein